MILPRFCQSLVVLAISTFITIALAETREECEIRAAKKCDQFGEQIEQVKEGLLRLGYTGRDANIDCIARYKVEYQCAAKPSAVNLYEGLDNLYEGLDNNADVGMPLALPSLGGQPQQRNPEDEMRQHEIERARADAQREREMRLRAEQAAKEAEERAKQYNSQLEQQKVEREKAALEEQKRKDEENQKIAQARELYQSHEGDVSSILSSFGQCVDEYKKTERCCVRPETCIAESLNAKGEDGSAAYKALQALGVLAGAVPATSIASACGRMKDVATGFAILNTALAAKCEQKVHACNSVCSEVATKAKAKLAELDQIDVNPYNQNWVVEFRSKLRRILDDNRSCKQFNNAVLEKAAQAVASAYSAKMAGMCQKAASNGAESIATNTFNVDCTNVANAANPVCQNACMRQGWENDPVCVAARGGRGSSEFGGGLGAGNPYGGVSTADIGDLNLPEDTQDPNFDMQANNAPGGVNAGQGGGGFDGGGGLYAAGGSGDGSGQGGGGSGYDKNVLAGIRSGGGYSIPATRGNYGGGYTGGYSGSRKPASDGKPFNPRDFLPGGRLDPKRKIAGLASAVPDVAAVHSNIFQNISNRFYQVCLRDGLMDCSTLRKRGRQGN